MEEASFHLVREGNPVRFGDPARSRLSSTNTAVAGGAGSRSVVNGRNKGIALTVGGIMMILLIKTGLVPFYWVTLMIGLTYVVAAVLSHSRGSLWAPGLMLSVAGLIVGLWIGDSHSPASLEFLALTILALGTGAVVAASMNRVGYDISAMSVALTLVAFGSIVLVAQQGPVVIVGNVYVVGGMFVGGGVLSLLQAGRHSDPGT